MMRWMRWAMMLVAGGTVNVSAESAMAGEDVMPLAGTWSFRLDPDRRGVREKWYEQALPDKVHLPGTTDENRVGWKTPDRQLGQLTRAWRYYGYAWYQRSVTIDPSWNGKQVRLFLERCQWDTRVWVNSRYVGTQNSLAAPHIYDLSGLLKPGENLLSILVDNSNIKDDLANELDAAATRPADGRPKTRDLTTDNKPTNKLNCGGHQTTDSTQTSWNGILGRIELQAMDSVRIDHLNAYPDIQAKSVRVKLDIGNATGARGHATVAVQICDRETGKEVGRREWPVTISGQAKQTATFEMSMGDSMRLWSEFTPAVYTLEATLAGSIGDRRFHDVKKADFGMRELRSEKGQILLNGRPVFLRGTLECAVFPLTGYAPTDIASWLRVLKIAQAYGLNHLRFHTWCPPEAAFEAADQLGLMLQVEPGGTSCPETDEDPAISEFLMAECLRIVETYGNHPSFCFLSVGGNEQLVTGKADVRAQHQALLMKRLDRVKAIDPRHLYTCCTQPWTPGRHDDYYVSAWGPKWEPLCAMRWGGPDPMVCSRFNLQPPSTMMDYRDAIAGIEGPIVSHEVGQWAVFPNIEEIPKYSGVLEARNFQIVRETLEKNGLLGQARDFVRSSGKLALELYKEDIESALRTPGFDGFQLLDLHDYPGQGTSTVGVLDAFWDSKGITTPEEFRRFCGPTVPLSRMEKRVWTDDETLQVTCELAHYGPADLADAVAIWSLLDSRGNVVANGSLPAQAIRTGSLVSLGKVNVPLKDLPAPDRLVFRLAVKDTNIINDWSLWVYPHKDNGPEPAEVDVVTAWGVAKTALQNGRSVLLLAFKPEQLAESITGQFTTLFWNVAMKHPQPGTMGILCDPKHPCLAMFPTEEHTDWQWWDLTIHSRTMVLDKLARDLKPIIQVIENLDNARKLGTLFEARVGAGRLVVCSMDLATDVDHRPAARQLRRSILSYMASSAFQPAQALEVEQLDTTFKGR